MARVPKDLNTYPAAFLDAAERAHAQLAIENWPMHDRRATISTVHSFNRFRVALARSGHPHAGAANDLIVRPGFLNGQHFIEFIPRGLWKPDELHVPGLVKHAPASTGQELEQMIVDKLSCVHEPDVYGICGKCGEPV